MTTILNSMSKIGTSQVAMAARFSTSIVDAFERVVAVQIEAANSALQEGVKNSQILSGRDMLTSPAEWPNWYAQWLRSFATNNARLTQEMTRKLHEATLQAHVELQQIATEQIEVLTQSAKDRIERIRDESATLLTNIGATATEGRGDEVVSAAEHPAKKAA